MKVAVRCTDAVAFAGTPEELQAFVVKVLAGTRALFDAVDPERMRVTAAVLAQVGVPKGPQKPRLV